MNRHCTTALISFGLALTAACGGPEIDTAEKAPKAIDAQATIEDQQRAPALTALPRLLSQTPWATGTREVFAPRFKLFTGAATKQREVVLPAGATLEDDGEGGWIAPEGTFLFKTLSVEGERIETRVAAKLQGRWVMSAYAWSGDDAVRVDDPAGLDADNGHHIPAATDCLTCHGVDDGETIEPRPVAFAPMMLDHDGDGLTTADLIADGRFHGQPSVRLQAEDPRDIEAMGYLAVNCGTCHREGGAASFSPLRLDIDPATGRFSALDAVGTAPSWVAPGSPLQLITAGDPQKSLLFVRMSATDGARMPMFAPDSHDTRGLALVKGFIERLGR
jgi:mono/diheme cytochrome c family protein